MRKLDWLACALMLGLLSACAGVQTEATEPTVTYDYSDDDEYDEVAEKADEFCEDRYDLDAHLVDRDRDVNDYDANDYDANDYEDDDIEGDGYEATFECR